jgi:hypothetical protein
VVSTPIMALFAIGVATIPTGNVPGPRWRPILYCAGFGLVSVAVGGVVLWPHRGTALLGQRLEAGPVAGLLWDLPYLILIPTAVGAVVSLIVRMKRSHGEQRLQLKWFAFAVVMAIVGVFVGPFRSDPSGDVVAGVGVLMIPAATAIAILRYRLYDIDVIVNRTLVYGSLTAILVGIYLSAVLVMQALLSGVTSDSDLAIAASTLAVAALFRPLRARVQQLIDRRFYRRKYDAARSLESFTQRLREEIDLELVEADMLKVLTETVEPAHSSLLLLGGPR